MIPRKKKLTQELSRVRRDIENGKYFRVPSGRRIVKMPYDKRNVLFKGYPRRCRLERLLRYSRLIILGLKSNY